MVEQTLNTTIKFISESAHDYNGLTDITSTVPLTGDFLLFIIGLISSLLLGVLVLFAFSRVRKHAISQSVSGANSNASKPLKFSSSTIKKILLFVLIIVAFVFIYVFCLNTNVNEIQYAQASGSLSSQPQISAVVKDNGTIQIDDVKISNTDKDAFAFNSVETNLKSDVDIEGSLWTIKLDDIEVYSGEIPGAFDCLYKINNDSVLSISVQDLSADKAKALIGHDVFSIHFKYKQLNKVAKPVFNQKTAPTYNDTYISVDDPSFWQNYDKNCMSIEGVTSACYIETSDVYFVLGQDYCWDDSTFDDFWTTWQLNKRALSIKGSSLQKEYNGAEFSDNTYTCSNLVDTSSCSVGYNVSGIDAGTYEGEFYSEANVSNIYGIDTTYCYEIEYVTGSLVITPTSAPFAVTMEEWSHVYDDLYVYNESVPESSALGGQTVFEYSTDSITYTQDITSIKARDVSETLIYVRGNNANYINSATCTTKLTISKKSVSFVGESKTSEYTGIEQYANGLAVNGLINGHTHNVVVTPAKGTNVNTYDGSITPVKDVKIYSSDETPREVSGNYSIECSPGQLTITKTSKPFTVSLDSFNWTYDGAQHTYPESTEPYSSAHSGTTTYTFKLNEQEPVTEISDVVVKDVGQYTVLVTATNPNYLNSATCTSTLDIVARKVYFVQNDHVEEYDSSEKTFADYTVYNLVNTHTHNFSCSVSGTEAGSYTGQVKSKDDIVIKDSEQLDVTKNYEIETQAGTLTITSPTSFAIALQQDMYTYDGEEHYNANEAVSSATVGTTTYQYSFEQQGEYVEDLKDLTKTDAGEYTIYVKAYNDKYTTKEASTTSKLIVTKASRSIKLSSYATWLVLEGTSSKSLVKDTHDVSVVPSVSPEASKDDDQISFSAVKSSFVSLTTEKLEFNIQALKPGEQLIEVNLSNKNYYDCKAHIFINVDYFTYEILDSSNNDKRDGEVCDYLDGQSDSNLDVKYVCIDNFLGIEGISSIDAYADFISVSKESEGHEIYIVTEIGSNSKSIISQLAVSKINSITVPYVNNINDNAFKDDVNLNKVVVPRLESIGDSAFEGCSSLSIFGGYAADNGIRPPSNTKYVGECAFSGCSSTNIDKVNLENLNNLETIEKKAFCNCSSVKNVYLPNSIKYILDDAFSGCAIEPDNGIIYDYNKTCILGSDDQTLNNEVLNIPSEIRVISTGAFSNNNKLRKVLIDNSACYINGQAFANCSRLQIFVIKNSYSKVVYGNDGVDDVLNGCSTALLDNQNLILAGDIDNLPSFDSASKKSAVRLTFTTNQFFNDDHTMDASYYYYLNKDQYLSSGQVTVNYNGCSVIDLNGYSINSNNANRLFVLNNASSSLYFVDTSEFLTGRLTGNAKVKNAKNGGFASITHGKLYMYSANIINCKSQADGGAIYVDNADDSQLYLFDQVEFKGNFAGYSSSSSNNWHNGGAVYVKENGYLYADGAIFDYNFALDGGAVYIKGYTDFKNCTFTRNHAAAGGSGGGIYANGHAATFDNCVFENNASTTSTGGGLYIYNTNIITLNSCILENNCDQKTWRTDSNGALFSKRSTKYFQLVNCIGQTQIRTN